MGTTLQSIHIFDPAQEECPGFRSFSDRWLTWVLPTTDDLVLSRKISRQTACAVLYFHVRDSEEIFLAVFRRGQMVARYSDDQLEANKKLYDIPALLGVEEGQKRRLSEIMACSDVDLKISMLEEYFGLCLLVTPELLQEPQALHREKGDGLYQQYRQQERQLTGRLAPISLELWNTYPGKLFQNHFGKGGLEQTADHYFLWGYTSAMTGKDLQPVVFSDGRLHPVENAVFCPRTAEDPHFQMDYGTPSRVTFSQTCPEGYRGRTMKLPNGYYPAGFTQGGELLLEGNHRIYVVDEDLKIIAKLSIQGDYADTQGDYILTADAESFYGYFFNPRATARVYRIVRKGQEGV